MKTISDLGEFGVIEELMRGLPTSGSGLLCGIGDDASVLSRSRSKIVVTTDLLEERVHFDRRFSPWDHVGYKALQANLSDIAAMGAKPRFFWLTLGLPRDFFIDDLKKFRSGLNRAARKSGVICAGGDTNVSRRGVTISLTLLGEAGRKIHYRQGARVGDAIYVTGSVGEAALGLILFQKGIPLTSKTRRYCRRHTKPEARVDAGFHLASIGIHAMIDISDGVAADLNHILKASGVGAEIYLEAVRPRSSFRNLCCELSLRWEDLVLTGGEDYELLFCAPPNKHDKIQRLSNKLRLPIKMIGRIVSGRSLSCFGGDGKNISLEKLGYEHFKK